MTSAPDQEVEGAATNMPGRQSHSTATQRQDTATGELLRDEGIALADESGDAWWRPCASTALLYFASLDQPFSADDVLTLVGMPDRPNQVGAVFPAAVVAGTIIPVGYVLSTRPSRHRGVQRLYRGGAER
jgi:hypothetical protein